MTIWALFGIQKEILELAVGYLKAIFESARIPSSRLGSFESIGRVTKSSVQSALCLRVQNFTLDESALDSSGRLELLSLKNLNSRSRLFSAWVGSSSQVRKTLLWKSRLDAVRVGSLSQAFRIRSGRVGSFWFGSARLAVLRNLQKLDSGGVGSDWFQSTRIH